MGEQFYGKKYSESDEVVFVGVPTFLKLPYIESSEELARIKPDIAIMGEPFDYGTSMKPGARYGPRAIRAASTQSPPYALLSTEMKIDPFSSLKVVDYGDVHVIPGDIIGSHDRMTAKVLEILNANATPVILGGDHSVTFANIRAFAKRFKGKLGIIHIDAHPDCSPSGAGGCAYDHGTFVRRVYELGCLDGGNYTWIGARGSWSDADNSWMEECRFKWFTMNDLDSLGIDGVATEAIRRAQGGTEAIWLTWDIDSFDPAYAPGTGTPEPGGLTSREGIRLMRKIAGSFDKRRFGFDLVEVSPIFDSGDSSSYSGGITSLLANRLVVELLQGLANNRTSGSPP